MPALNTQNLQAGDVVLFEWKKGGWHTALYSGGGKIIHCVNEEKGTVEDDLQTHAKDASRVHCFRLGGKTYKTQAVTLARRWATQGRHLPAIHRRTLKGDLRCDDRA